MGLNEALRPIADPSALSKATPEQFAERAAKVLSEPNYVHPFREGNGRAQEAFISELGRHYGHAIDFSLITMPRMIEASIETTNDPSSPLMKHAIEDAIKPGRREAIRSAFDDLRESGEEPLHHPVRTARAGEDITGRVLRQGDRFAILLTDHGIVVADRADLPERLPHDEKITVTARSEFSNSER
ncbi:filamentation induced by cAMP protein fic [Sinorhizobium meliloti CCNWSX0020]|uniref:Filamentation induced by cAMP protein fic n=1 Tax=Sinorhizobium meliloti CCNWSX0020 TaxID=1107881 RepID=H0G7N8_RHIML|nr:filamentation induced by cAMP protein fic [Sinorhizobium meliloti CCNWSX0020]